MIDFYLYAGYHCAFQSCMSRIENMVDISIWVNLSFCSKTELELEVAKIYFAGTFFFAITPKIPFPLAFPVLNTRNSKVLSDWSGVMSRVVLCGSNIDSKKAFWGESLAKMMSIHELNHPLYYLESVVSGKEKWQYRDIILFYVLNPQILHFKHLPK